MGHKKHHADAGKRSVPVHIVVVSSTRTHETDRSGPALIAALDGAGHSVAANEIVPDDAGRIRSRLESLVTGGARAIIFAGGTGISSKDGTMEAVGGALDKTLPGFGELFRMLSYKEIGSSAMLSRAVGGVMGDAVVFAIPGSPAACRLAVKELIAPELSHLLYELDKEKEYAPEAPSSEGASVTGAAIIVDQPTDSIPPSVLPSGWMLRLWQLGGILERGGAMALNERLAAIPLAVNVLSTAGAQATVTIGDDRYLAFGFPDLKRSSSRVLLVGEGEPYGEILALHRWPARTGALRNDAGGLLGASGRLGALAREVTGADYPESGRVLAVEPGAIYVTEGGTRVFRWDGRARKEVGAPASTLASLLLQWSQR